MRRLAIGLAAAALLVAGCKDEGTLTSSDPKEVAKAIHAASSAGDDRAVERIAPLASHADTQTASEAVLALGRMSSPKALAVLQQVAATDYRPEVRRVAVVSLAQRKEPQAAEALRETLTRDQAPEVRTAAAMGLARAGTVDDVSALATAVGRETNPKVAQAEVLAMGGLLGVRFPLPDPKMAPEQRRAQLQRIRKTAMELAEAKKNGTGTGGCKHDSPR
jgi:HEAT repeat protein